MSARARVRFGDKTAARRPTDGSVDVAIGVGTQVQQSPVLASEPPKPAARGQKQGFPDGGPAPTGVPQEHRVSWADKTLMFDLDTDFGADETLPAQSTRRKRPLSRESDELPAPSVGSGQRQPSTGTGTGTNAARPRPASPVAAACGTVSGAEPKPRQLSASECGGDIMGGVRIRVRSEACPEETEVCPLGAARQETAAYPMETDRASANVPSDGYGDVYPNPPEDDDDDDELAEKERAKSCVMDVMSMFSRSGLALSDTRLLVSDKLNTPFGRVINRVRKTMKRLEDQAEIIHGEIASAMAEVMQRDEAINAHITNIVNMKSGSSEIFGLYVPQPTAFVGFGHCPTETFGRPDVASQHVETFSRHVRRFGDPEQPVPSLPLSGLTGPDPEAELQWGGAAPQTHGTELGLGLGLGTKSQQQPVQGKQQPQWESRQKLQQHTPDSPHRPPKGGSRAPGHLASAAESAPAAGPPRVRGPDTTRADAITEAVLRRDDLDGPSSRAVRVDARRLSKMAQDMDLVTQPGDGRFHSTANKMPPALLSDHDRIGVPHTVFRSLSHVFDTSI